MTSPTPRSRSGTPRRSTTTAPSCCSPTNGAAARSRCASRTIRRCGAATRCTTSRARATAAICTSVATSRCRRGRPRRRTAWRTTAASCRCPAATSCRRPSIRAARRFSISRTPARIQEIAYFDRGPIDANSWSSAATGRSTTTTAILYGSEIARGLDVFQLTPSEYLSQNEIDAAKLATREGCGAPSDFNAQCQPHYIWPDSFVVARAYLDQLTRDKALPQDRADALNAAMKDVEDSSGSARSAAKTKLDEPGRRAGQGCRRGAGHRRRADARLRLDDSEARCGTEVASGSERKFTTRWSRDLASTVPWPSRAGPEMSRGLRPCRTDRPSPGDFPGWAPYGNCSVTALSQVTQRTWRALLIWSDAST